MSENFKFSKLNALFCLIVGVVTCGYCFNQISICSAIFVVCVTSFVRFVFVPADSDMILLFYEHFGKSLGDIEGKVIWVTGASTGIGEALAVALSRGKTKLVLSARSEEKLNEVRRKCMEVGNLESKDVLVLPFDMTNYDKHEWAFSTALKHFGQLDVLISNAGRSQRAWWERIDTAVDKSLFDLNVFALINLARIVTKHFLTVGGGKHVVTSSVTGKVAMPMSASYTASKYALRGYFESLRAEKGSKGISITVLCPGPVESNLMEGIFAEKLDQKINKTRTVKLMSSERCAHLIVVAMVNDVSEAWICHQPVLLFLYLTQYQPALLKWFQNKFDFTSIVMKIRDGPPPPPPPHTSSE